LDLSSIVSEALLQKGCRKDEKSYCILVANGECIESFGTFNLGYYLGKGLIHEVDGVTELGTDLRLSKAILSNTFSSYNLAIQKGKDEFGKKIFPVPFSATEKLCKVPSLTTIIRFSTLIDYAYVTPVIRHTLGGLKINKYCQVLKKSRGMIFEQPIQGLFAAGEVTGGNGLFVCRCVDIN
jgi:hypothetical protein